MIEARLLHQAHGRGDGLVGLLPVHRHHIRFQRIQEQGHVGGIIGQRRHGESFTCISDQRDLATCTSQNITAPAAPITVIQPSAEPALAQTPVAEAAANASTNATAALNRAGRGAITTEIAPAPEFFYAEDYHQGYLAKNPAGYCGIGGTGVTCPIGVGVEV